MNVFAICAVCVITAVISLAIKRYNGEMSIIIAIAGCIVVLLSVISYTTDIFSQINSIIKTANIKSDYVAILIKALGICFITEFSSDCCKDAGQLSLANNCTTIGRLLVLVTALPLFKEILNTAVSLITMQSQ